MSWKILLTVGLITAITTALVTIPVADYVTKANKVSDFEGARGMMIAFILIPAGFIGGFLVGLVGTNLVHATEWSQFWKAAGVSIMMGQLGLFGIAGLSLISLPAPPLLDGDRLALELEFQVPLESITPRSLQPDQIRMSLYAGPKDNSYATVDSALFREENGKLIVTVLADLNSTSYERSVHFSIEEHIAVTLGPLPINAKPTSADMEWTAWAPLRKVDYPGTNYTDVEIRVRMRVVKHPKVG